jgi:hypothetical protein
MKWLSHHGMFAQVGIVTLMTGREVAAETGLDESELDINDERIGAVVVTGQQLRCALFSRNLPGDLYGRGIQHSAQQVVWQTGVELCLLTDINPNVSHGHAPVKMWLQCSARQHCSAAHVDAAPYCLLCSPLHDVTGASPRRSSGMTS